MTEDIFKQEMLPETKPTELPIKSTPGGATLEVGNFISPNYSKGRSGWKIDSEGDAEFDDIKARGNMERNDFHWTTFFESLDGSTVTGGPPTINGLAVTITTAGTGADTVTLTKSPYFNSDLLSWSKDRKIRTEILFAQDTDQEIEIVTGKVGVRRFGFKVIDDTLYGVVGGEVGDTTISLGTINVGAGISMSLEASYKARKSVTFTVNGVEKGTITDDLPTTEGEARYLYDIDVTETAAAAKTIQISYWDLWQGV